MTELEAADRLCALLNEIEAAGHAVQISPGWDGSYHLMVGEGDVYLAEPPCEGEPWEVRR